MNLVLDPVWPWSRLWEALLQVPPALRSLAGLAMLLVVPLLLLGKAARPLRAGLVAALAVALALLARHLAPLALNDGRQLVGSGLVAYPIALLILGGWLGLLLIPTSLAGWSAAGYLANPGTTRRRLALVAGLRLAAFAVAIFALLRPALAWAEKGDVRSQLFVLLDRSRSMTIQDESGKQARWDLALRSLREATPGIDRLRDDQQVEVRFFAFADTLGEFDPEQPGTADGKRTDLGMALRRLYELRDPRVPLRGILQIGDGADNGSGVPALSEASRWRGLPAALHTFACGNPRTSREHNDVALTAISTSPTPFVPVKGRLNVKVSIDARGYENSKARLRLFLEGADEKGVVADREVLARDVVLRLTTGNEEVLTIDAPSRPGEVKVKVVIETPEADDFPTNNVIETFVTVSKEGISVLLVDRARLEPVFIHDALAQDPRIRVTAVLLRGGRPPAGSSKLFAIDDQPYDVILLGDVTATQLKALDPEALVKIDRMVGRGSGLMVLGGYTNLGNGDWQGTPLEAILPVDLSVKGQREEDVRMRPTEDGVRRARYLLRLDDHPEVSKTWEKLAKLEGTTRLGLPNPRRGTEVVLAETDGKEAEPLLVMQHYARKDAKGGTASVARVLVLGGDTTHRWKRTEEGDPLHARFWKQVVVWLAKQEDAEGSVWIRPDVRRLPVRHDLGFQVGLRGKGGGPDLREGKYEVEVIGPDGTKARVPVARSTTENRGVVTATAQPGIYRLVVRGEGKDPSGRVVSGESSARVIVYDEDLEMLRPAADPEFLKKVAAAGGGEALRVEQLADFVNRLAEQPLERGKPKQLLQPDWRTTQRSRFLMGLFALFSVLVCLEWALRRAWGLV